jgi:hypothetical protein
MIMDSRTLRDKLIKPKLVESFGNVLASSIMISGTSAGMTAANDDAKKIAIIDAICSNPKVKSMWGSKVNRFKREWMAA